MDNPIYCPYCGSPLASDRYCDQCGSDIMPGEALTLEQFWNWVHMPRTGITALFLAGAGAAAVGFSITFIRMANLSVMGVMAAISAALLLTTGISFIGLLTVRTLFGRLAAQQLDRFTKAAFVMAGAFGFWPFLGLILSAL